jgi:surface carbohydrate biosynthesis protein
MINKKKFLIKNSNVICFPIEVKIREFLPKIFLAYKIIKHTNFKVIFGGQRYITNNYNYENCLWFDKNTFYNQRKKFPIHLKNKIIMLDEEGPISFFSKANLKLRYNISIVKQVSNFLFSGVNDIKNLNQEFLKRSFKIFGQPKFDLIKNCNLKVYNTTTTLIKARYGDFLFIPGHWTSIRSIDNLKKESNLLFSNKITDSKNFTKNCEIYLKNYYLLLDLVKKIAIENPNLTVVFRKHPSEDEYFIKSYFKEKPSNLKLVYKYNITPWILACKYYLHSGCQSYLEALALKKKIVSYYPIKYNHTNNFYLSFPIFDNEKICLEFFKKNLFFSKNFLIKKNVYKIVKNIKNKYFFHKEFSKFLNKEYFLLNSNVIYKPKINKIYKYLSNFMYSFFSLIKNYFLKNAVLFSIISKFFRYENLVSKNIKTNKFRSLLKSEIEYYLNIFAKIDKFNNKIFIRKLDKNVFLMHK